jgi:DNA (cytosine-5)-methyltransferase 1
LNELALFAGAGGGILGGHLLGWRTVAAVEIEDYPRRVLLQRQADGLLPRFPIWDDICTFDGKPWAGKVDVISGGFPCQDISAAGKGAGLDGERSGLWGEMARVIHEVQPRFVFVENSPMLTSRGLGRVLGDLAKMGFDAKWGVLGADAIGLPHHRERIWVLATNNDSKYAKRMFKQTIQGVTRISREYANGMDKNEQGLRSILSPGLCRTPNGLSGQMDRLKAIGNAQVPRVAANAWRILNESSTN